MTIKQAELYASDNRGVYIPQHFAESYEKTKWNPIDPELIADLLAGPESENYWTAWDLVLDNAETLCGGTLHQDGDLWIVWPQLAIDAINEHCGAMLEYETSHNDAGDIYAHMVSESWDEQEQSCMMDQLTGPEVQDLNKDCFEEGRWVPKWKVDAMGLDPDAISDLALDLFVMERGSIWGPYADGITLASYAIGEIEICLEHLGIDGITMDLIRESCDAYIGHGDLAYEVTDAVWFAVVNPETLQSAIAAKAANIVADKESI
jgi:hypothetical protein